MIRLACAMARLMALQATAQLVVKTEAGLVAGLALGSDVRVWKGIPYAHAPTGDLR